MEKSTSFSNDREFFDSFFPGLVNDIVKEGENDKETGKRNRGLSVIGSLRHLVSPDKLTEEQLKTASILGWCVEWVTYQTATGQTLDLITQPGENFENFTLERYKAIAGIKDASSHDNAKVILLAMGEFFQIQDDYLDCYGDPAVTGKVGTDIEERKCSWLVVQALNRISDKQMQILKDNYGVKNSAASDKVKKLYNEMELKKLYQEYEQESYQQILQLIARKSENLPKEMFLEFVKKIYKRDK
ncbi:Farnesyl pyrophosphate synthase [Acropora cervicornis]|uniref:Farnesyl pyrophosphate synthase n=1 Tax=Acropora cervicornis TaxID=6130 RepID=A0AAD9UW72_ACRCE|nr:Farnesyl pyrophosphate synthase [Acropora cervicornis]